MALPALPNELLLQIATCKLPHSSTVPLDVIRISLIARRFVFLTQDYNCWRARCYQDSRAATRRRREQLLSQQPDNLAALARAVSGVSGLPSSPVVSNPNAPNAEMQAHRLASQEQSRALANWDPAYPTEKVKVNFYQEYIHRHAPIKVSWFETHGGRADGREELPEASGAGILYDSDGRAQRLFAPLEDGSIAIWDSTHSQSRPEDSTQGRLVARSPRGFLSSRRTGGSIVRETGVVECVSIDSRQQRGFFAVENGLVQVDLSTLQIISRDNFVWPVNAISEAAHPTPLTVGTTYHLHLLDPRDRTRDSLDPSPQIDHVGGPQLERRHDISHLINAPPPQYAVLSQPGPLSILHLPEDRAWDGNGDIWVAGRFTHLLNYDRRFFPRLRGTVHSGARISSLTSLPFPFIPRERNLMQSNQLSVTQVTDAKSILGTTIIAAGEYKGKGSLELYGLSPEPEYTTLSTDSFSGLGRGRFSMTGGGGGGNCAQNRQTASSSKLLSVAAHGLKLVYSDGDAKLKWVERDGFTPIREFSIDPDADARGFIDQGHEADPEPSVFATGVDNSGDIVQKIIPTLHRSTLASNEYTPRLHEDSLVVWTGDGRLGMVGFGKHSGWREDAWIERAEQSVEEAERKGEEKQYGQKMREALQWQADEARFMSGLGLPFVARGSWS
ncbi:hypothetical protein NA57DRAFT_69176 [Rhizodiscina lignyota]|uniref:F-box domain-containing protein n=1 Tax=Rhizodiscina lignyota TaxID=1504668 RepID=A0A9P4I651_9PEZI|nr:hypothetical protein NA57DRAFT_69176 [Rhizodiscina lignyota]